MYVDDKGRYALMLSLEVARRTQSRYLWYGRFDRIQVKKKENVCIGCQKERWNSSKKRKSGRGLWCEEEMEDCEQQADFIETTNSDKRAQKKALWLA